MKLNCVFEKHNGDSATNLCLSHKECKLQRLFVYFRKVFIKNLHKIYLV